MPKKHFMNLKSYLAFEQKISFFVRKRAPTLLRYALAFIYIWYGLLKILGKSPVEELVFRATHWIGVSSFVFLLGCFEVLTGLCLFWRTSLRLGLLLLFLQFPGTFLPLFTNPADCFTHIPWGLTLEGQYIFKNMILISAALVLVGSLHASSSEKP